MVLDQIEGSFCFRNLLQEILEVGKKQVCEPEGIAHVHRHSCQHLLLICWRLIAELRGSRKPRRLVHTRNGMIDFRSNKNTISSFLLQSRYCKESDLFFPVSAAFGSPLVPPPLKLLFWWFVFFLFLSDFVDSPIRPTRASSSVAAYVCFVASWDYHRFTLGWGFLDSSRSDSCDEQPIGSSHHGFRLHWCGAALSLVFFFLKLFFKIH